MKALDLATLGTKKGFKKTKALSKKRLRKKLKEDTGYRAPLTVFCPFADNWLMDD